MSKNTFETIHDLSTVTGGEATLGIDPRTTNSVGNGTGAVSVGGWWMRPTSLPGRQGRR